MCTGKIKHGIKGKIDVRSIALYRFCAKLIYEKVCIRVNYSEFYFLILNLISKTILISSKKRIDIDNIRKNVLFIIIYNHCNVFSGLWYVYYSF